MIIANHIAVVSMATENSQKIQKFKMADVLPKRVEKRYQDHEKSSLYITKGRKNLSITTVNLA